MSVISQTANVARSPAVGEPLRLPVGQRPCTPEYAPDFRYRPEIGQAVRSVCPETDWKQSGTGSKGLREAL